MSKVSIVNRALALLGANKIVNLSDNTEEAKSANNMYDGSLRSILAECPWNFALKRANLNMITTTPEWGGGNYFQKPADCVRIFDSNVDDLKIEGQYVKSNSKSVGILYTYLCTNTDLYSPSFIDAFSYRLAHDMCFDLTNVASKQAELIQLYESHFLPIAKSKNAKEQAPDKIKDDLWVNSLRGV